MANIRRYKPTEVRDAIIEYGTLLAAAQALGCHHTTISEYVKEFPDEVAPAVRQGRINLVAKAEKNLAMKIHEGDENASKWWLANSAEGKAAGFGGRNEVTQQITIDPQLLGPERPSTWAEARVIYTQIESEDIDDEEEG